ncbi:MAG: VanZ family protein [Comamonadaceae bacterium]|nr:VanZ family protein [Comamonadaceae bacterium]
MAHKTIAWPLALSYAALIVFASLFPFSGWRAQGISPWEFFVAPVPPPYWTWFDVNANWAGYAPLGFLLALALMRSGWPRAAWALAALAGALLSLGMECLQIYLPQRVASNLDWLLNSGGSLLGALLAALLERAGAIDHWARFRARWFVPQAHGALVLLALWPPALLFPAALPFGLGQVQERLEAAAAEALDGTPFLDWLPLGGAPLEPLARSTEVLCVLLGLLVPGLLGYSVIARRWQRVRFALVMLVLGVALTALSSALAWGPQHAWEWLGGLPVRLGLVLAVPLLLAALLLPARACAALALLALALHLSLLNQAPTSAYFAQTLQQWEQGRFVRFYGLSQWLGWLWPYATLLVLLLRLSRRERRGGEPTIAPHD